MIVFTEEEVSMLLAKQQEFDDMFKNIIRQKQMAKYYNGEYDV